MPSASNAAVNNFFCIIRNIFLSGAPLQGRLRFIMLSSLVFVSIIAFVGCKGMGFFMPPKSPLQGIFPNMYVKFLSQTLVSRLAIPLSNVGRSLLLEVQRSVAGARCRGERREEGGERCYDHLHRQFNPFLPLHAQASFSLSSALSVSGSVTTSPLVEVTRLTTLPSRS